MEWLLAHADDTSIAPECVSADSTNTTEQTAASGSNNGASSSSSNVTESTTPGAKSFKCEEW